MIRQPIITVLGHVDHGKTSLLDYTRANPFGRFAKPEKILTEFSWPRKMQSIFLWSVRSENPRFGENGE